MTDPQSEQLVAFDYTDVEDVWVSWAPPGDDDVLARAAFERMLHYSLGLEDDGLYFRPGGWRLDVAATAARLACASAILAALFQLAGLEDLDREIVIAAAGLAASMDVSPVRPGRREQRIADRLRSKGLDDTPLTARPGRREQRIADRLRSKGLDDTPLTAAQAHKALAKKQRRQVTEDEVAEALDLLVDAGFADREDDEHWVLRPSRRAASASGTLALIIIVALA